MAAVAFCCAVPLLAAADEAAPELILARDIGVAGDAPQAGREKDGDSQPETGLKPNRTIETRASGTPAAPAPAGSQLLIAEIDLNGVRKGEVTVVALPDGDFLVGGADLGAMDVKPPYGDPLSAEGQEYFSLRALHPSELRLDEARLVLFVTLPPERLPKKALDLQPGRPSRVLEPRDDAGFFNYRALSAGDNTGGRGATTLSTELGLRRGDFLLSSESWHVRANGLRQDLRYGTSLTHDDRRTLQRWTIGDFTATSGDLGGTLTLGGISLSKTYQIDPYFLRRPMAGFTGNVAAPSQAEIYLDGVRVRTETLQPGQFELRNLNYYGGRREVAVVIRDRFGREQRLVYPFYFADVNLREGLHEYSYAWGAQRQNLGSASNDYRNGALTAFHRYGFNDNLTLGARGEAEAGRYNVGPTMAWRSDRWGVLSGSLARGNGPSGRGWAGAARYAYQVREFSGQVEARHLSGQYENVGQAPGADRPKTEHGAGVSYGLASLGSVSVDWRQLRQYLGADQRTASVAYSRTLFGSLSLLASISRVSGMTESTNVFVALTYSPGRDFTAHTSHDRRAGSRSDIVQFGNATPVGEGFGYRVFGERSDAGVGDGYRWAPSLQYNGSHAVLSADLSQTRTPDGRAQQARQFGIGGSVAYLDGHLAFARPITDSFGIVKVGDLEGVRVYHSAQQVGRTDASGTVFLPNLGSYFANRVAIDDRDVPMEYVIADKELNVSPPLRSGSVIRFGVSRVYAVTGRLAVRVAGTAQAAEYVDLIVTVDGREMRFPTGTDGEFYIENLQPGRHAVHFVFGQRRCGFELAVPESRDMVTDLGVMHVCHFDN